MQILILIFYLFDSGFLCVAQAVLISDQTSAGKDLLQSGVRELEASKKLEGRAFRGRRMSLVYKPGIS